MTQQHPTPTYELVEKWIEQFNGDHLYVAIRAAQWGADQELESCCEWLNGGSKYDHDTAALLRDARRPKPPSLKEQALADFDWMVGRTLGKPEFDERSGRIRRALEQLPDHE